MKFSDCRATGRCFRSPGNSVRFGVLIFVISVERHDGPLEARSASPRVPSASRSSRAATDILDGATIYGTDEVGHVSHLHGSGSAAQVVIDVGGFLGIGAKPVAVPISDLEFMRDEDGKVHAVTT